MQNGTMMQYFHWYYPADGSLWKNVKEEAPRLSELGITALWLPPAFKAASGAYSTGYDVYDLYDLGEFNQKGSVRTKYGTKEEYDDAIKAMHHNGIQAYVDVVVNHKGGGDETELIQAIKVDQDNRMAAISEPYDIEAFTNFTFPARQGRYSDFVWNHTCFTGVDYDARKQENAIFSIINEWGNDWEDMVSEEKGNYDYLMYCDIEFRNPHVREELRHWGEWYWNTIQFDGMRLDAVKHIAPHFFNEWLTHMRKIAGKDLFAVAEYWAPGNLPLLLKYIEATEGKLSLFDAALQNKLHRASKEGNNFNMAEIFNDTLVAVYAPLAVTLVDNHDTQPLQSLEAPVEHWFKPIAYALILLRMDGYPCVFYPDVYGAEYTDRGNDGNNYTINLQPVAELPMLLQLRKNVAYGAQRDYMDHPNCIGWTREGDADHTGSGCAVVLSNGDAGNKYMEIGKSFAGIKFKDALGHISTEITVNEEGWAEFLCAPGSVSVWVPSV